MTLIDQVAPGQASEIASGDWSIEQTMKSSNLAQTAADTLNSIEGAMSKKGDNGITAWLDTDIGGKTRRAKLTAEFEAGLRLGRMKIIDIFTATRFDLFKKKERATKKQMKAVAAAATTLDRGDAKYANSGGAPNYCAELKRRATWMKTH
jgi:hypothetical protein